MSEMVTCFECRFLDRSPTPTLFCTSPQVLGFRGKVRFNILEQNVDNRDRIGGGRCEYYAPLDLEWEVQEALKWAS